MLLYDLTSTYFEGDPAVPEERHSGRYGYSRDKRPDCVQVVIALVVTPEGLPLAYEVMAGNTSDKTTLRGFLDKIEALYGKARADLGDGSRHPDRGGAGADAGERSAGSAIWWARPRAGEPLRSSWLELPWQKVREGVEVKLLAQEGELYVLAQSRDRLAKERAMRRRRSRDCGGGCGSCGHAMELRREDHY